jgi:hypothetical protein
VPSLVADGRRDVAIRPLREPVPLVALSLLVQVDADPLVEHFVTAITES